MTPLLLLALSACPALKAQPPGANYDEAKVPAYTLPDLLVLSSGERVTDARSWREKRRPEILELLRTHVYGHSPGRPPKMTFELTRVTPAALGGKALRKEVSVYSLRKPPALLVRIHKALPFCALLSCG